MSNAFCPPAGPRARVISDNDYAGDPDGLFQLVHHALSPSVDLRAVIGSHLAPGDPFDSSGRSAANATAAAQRMLDVVGGATSIPVVKGSETALVRRDRPQPSEATEVIIAEALRTDTELPLFLTLGAGLTELASALLIEPAIADKITAVWIGGPEHPALGVAPPPGAAAVEYNLAIDLLAGQVVFDSEVPFWQVPRNAYREALVSMTELLTRVRPYGEVGKHLYESLDGVHTMATRHGGNLGETYVLGDNPLVLLTALQSSFEADPSSSRYTVLPRPRIDDAGGYVENPTGPPMRVYGGLDVRLMLEDLYAKLQLAAADPGREH